MASMSDSGRQRDGEEMAQIPTGASPQQCRGCCSPTSVYREDEGSRVMELELRRQCPTCQGRTPDLLYLFLGLHVNSNIPGGCWNWLTMYELANLKCVSKELWRQLQTIVYGHCRDENDYLLQYPGAPGVLTKGGGLFPHQLASIQAMHEAENRSKQYGALRGGILGDAPGLGKTITLLSLVAATAGQRVVAPKQFWDETSSQFQEAWAVARVNESSVRSVMKITLHLRRWLRHVADPQSHEAQVVLELLRYIQPPYVDDRFLTVGSLERHVKKALRGVVPPFVLDQLRQGFTEFRAGLDKRGRRLFASPEGRYLRWERSLIESSATLIIVPDSLLEHWFQQIHEHVNLRVFSESADDVRGVVYLDGFGDMADIVNGGASLRHIDLRKRLAPAWEISQYLMVITTFSRCERQWKDELFAGRCEGGSKKRTREAVAVAADLSTSSSLLQVRWLRLVVDEGHELGEHPTGSDVTRFLNQVAAERRWVLSGTPTTGDEDDNHFRSKAMDQLQRLLLFLRHPKYGHFSERIRKVATDWTLNIKKPFLANDWKGRDMLMQILKDIMVVHRKEDIHLHSPIFRQIEREVVVPVATESDLLTAFGSGRRLVHAFDVYLHGPDFQSLVDQTQAEYIIWSIQEARQELRKNGCRRIAEGGRTFFDQRDIKAVVYSSTHNILLSITEFIVRQLGNENVSELYKSDRIGDMNAELSRYRHGLKECKACPVCNRDETNFAVMKSTTGCSNKLLEVVSSSDGLYRRFLIEPERICEAFVDGSRMEGELLSSYSKSEKYWRIGDNLLVDIRDPHPVLAARQSEQVWHDEFGSEKCKDLALKDAFQGRDWYFGQLPDDRDGTGRLEVTLKKWQRCRQFHNSSWYTGPRLCDQPIHEVPEDVFVMALDASLSHGLDLSFVTHIFLLDPIDDAALLEQVTSRAHRIGATGPVEVTTVNTHYKDSEEFRRALNVGALTERMQQNDVSLLETVICEHCYRSFPSRAAAEEHEQSNCPRNPAIIQFSDPFRLSSVYREIKPPPAVKVRTRIDADAE